MKKDSAASVTRGSGTSSEPTPRSLVLSQALEARKAPMQSSSLRPSRSGAISAMPTATRSRPGVFAASTRTGRSRRPGGGPAWLGAGVLGVIGSELDDESLGEALALQQLAEEAFGSSAIPTRPESTSADLVPI